MIKLNIFIITVFFILSLVNFCYCKTTEENIKENNYYQIIKNLPISFGKVFETNINNE